MRFFIKVAASLLFSVTALAAVAQESGVTHSASAAGPGSKEIRKEVCSFNKPIPAANRIERKPVLPGEITGINTFYLEMPQGRSYLYKPGKKSVSLFLVTHGKGNISQGNRNFEVDNVNLFVPSVLEKASIMATGGTLGILEIIIELNDKEFQSVKQQTGTLPYFVDYTKCTPYKEVIKSPKTVSRTILPENIIPRFAMGSVETTGPDTVGAHAHPMLEQLFFGLATNDCIVKADEAVTTFSENMLLHIPLGSTHGVKVDEGKVLYYVWMDLFRSSEDMNYIREHHITNDK
jgi:hypothetical protein